MKRIARIALAALLFFGKPALAQWANWPQVQGPFAVNCNATGDTTFTINAPTNYTVNQLRIVAETGLSFNTAKFGLFTGASQTGVTLIAQATAISGLTATGVNTTGNAITVAASAYELNSTSLFFNVGTQQGGTCTINVYVVMFPLVGG